MIQFESISLEQPILYHNYIIINSALTNIALFNMNHGDDFKRTLLEVSQLQPQQSFLYTSYYNSVSRPNKQVLAEVSQWVPTATKVEDTLVRKRKRVSEVTVAQFLPKLEERASPVQILSHRYNYPMSPPEIDKQYSSMETLVQPKVALTEKAEKIQQKPKLRTILLGLSLPKVVNKHSLERFSKYDALSNSVSNNLEKLKKSKYNQHLPEQKPIKLGKSHTRLLNDQLINLLVPNKPNRRHTSKISSIKYSFKRKARLSEPIQSPSLQIRNGSILSTKAEI